MLEPNFPAAHSMDTTWYAVDAVGHVAQFDTGENGHAPKSCDISLSVYNLREQFMTVEAEDWLPEVELAAHFGLYHFDYDDSYDPIAPFYRTDVPTIPLHIDSLPPAFRKAWKMVRFRTIVFAEAKLLQPLDFMPCLYWYDSRVAFVASDGVTIRPIAGHEHEFAPFVADMQRERADEAAKFTFMRAAPHYKPNEG